MSVRVERSSAGDRLNVGDGARVLDGSVRHHSCIRRVIYDVEDDDCI